MANSEIELIERTDSFLADVKHIKDSATLEKIEKQIRKIMIKLMSGSSLKKCWMI